MSKHHIDSSTLLPCELPFGKRFQNLIGQKVERLEIVSFAGYRLSNEGHRQFFWNAICSCGKTTIVRGQSFRSGGVKSCGCWHVESAAINGAKRATHRMSDSIEFSIWVGMNHRCYSPNYDGYYLYGGRGITVCDRWRESFQNFYDDMGPRPKGKTLERKNNDGPYSPENVVWATPKEQARNRRTNHMITFKGVTKCMIEFEEEYNLPFGQIQRRLYKGWSLEDAITTPCNKTGPLKKGEFKNNYSWKSRRDWVSAWKCSCKWKTPNRDDIAPNDDGEYACPKCGNKNMRDRGF